MHISKHCETINYIYLECTGYCESNTYFYKDEEISSASCCSLRNIEFKEVKLHCFKKLLLPSDLTNEHSLYRKDVELMQTFQNSFKSSQWTEIEPSSETTSNTKKSFSGFYTILMATNASCECSKMNEI